MSLQRELLDTHNILEIMSKYKVSRTQAFQFKAQGYAVRRNYPQVMPSKVDYLAIARRSAWFMTKRSGDVDLRHECEQAVLVRLWKDADKVDAARAPDALAHTIAKTACLNVLKSWRHKEDISLDDWLPLYEQDGPGSLDMDN